MQRLRATAFASFVLAVPLSSAVALDMQKVTVSLSSASVSDPVPFDEPFILKGTVSPQVQSLRMLIGKADGLCQRTKNPVTVLADPCITPFSVTNPISDAQEWRRRTAAENEFQFVVPPLDPNSCYQIRFQQQLAPAGETDRKELQAELAGIVRTQIANIARNQSGVPATDRATLQHDLRARFKSFVESRFNACAPTDLIDFEKPENLQPVVAVFTATTLAENAKKSIEQAIVEIETETCVGGCSTDTLTPTPLTMADWDDFRKKLSDIIDNPALLSPASKSAWDGTLGGARVADLARIAIEVTSNQSSMDGLLRGSLKIGGPVLVPATGNEPDVASIEQMRDFFTLVSSDLFRLAPPAASAKATGKTKAAAPVAGPPVFSDRFRARASTLVEAFRVLTRGLHEKAQGLNAVGSSTFPDVLASRLLSQHFEVTTSPTLITANKNPYISLDAGLAYSPRVSKGFPYAGANFYFVPVNKNAPLSRFHGRERLLKTTSILVGLTTSAFEEGRVKNFFASGSPMLGVGYRFNQFVKINGGVMAFKLQDANPAIDRKDNEYSAFASISIDIDVKTLLGNVGNLF